MATIKMLQTRINFLNNLFGKTKGDIGFYQLGESYGGCRLERVENEHSSVKDCLGLGYISKPKLLDGINCFIQGVREHDSNC